MQLRYNREGLRKHAVAEREVDAVVADKATRWFSLPDTRRGQIRSMLVGFTAEGRLLEVGYQEISPEVDYIFHAMDATKLYREKFSKNMTKKTLSGLTRDEWIVRAQTEARRRIVKRGIVHFRLNEELMELLLQAAEYKHLGAGVLARMWVVEQLREAQTKGHLYQSDRDKRDQTIAERPPKYKTRASSAKSSTKRAAKSATRKR